VESSGLVMGRVDGLERDPLTTIAPPTFTDGTFTLLVLGVQVELAVLLKVEGIAHDCGVKYGREEKMIWDLYGAKIINK